MSKFDAASLIRRSIIEDRIVFASHTDDLESALRAECDDWIRANDGVIEFWYAPEDPADDGCDWRVHLTTSDVDSYGAAQTGEEFYRN